MNIEFEYEGVWITNATLDETGRFEVNPVEYYGETYLNAQKKCQLIEIELIKYKEKIK